MGARAAAQASWEAPYVTLTGELWLWYSTAPPHIPAGIYDRPSDVIGFDSVKVPDGRVSQFLRDATKFTKWLTDFGIGPDDWLPILIPGPDD